MTFIAIGVALLIACPFVSQEEAKEKARKYAQEQLQLHEPERIQMAEPKLDNWTWVVSGWRTSKYSQPVRFFVNIHSKRGTATNLRYIE